MYRDLPKLILKLTQIAMLMSFLGTTFGIPCGEIVHPKKTIPDRCTCNMTGGGDHCCDCPFCKAHHITSMMGCGMMCCCGFTRPIAQDPKPFGESINFFFDSLARDLNCYEAIVVRRMPGTASSLSEGVKSRLIKPPRQSLLLQTITSEDQTI